MNTYSEDKMYENYSSEVERMQKCIDELLQENQQLKRNCNIGNENLNFYREEYKKSVYDWNKLKKFLKIRLHKNCNLSFYGVVQIREELEKVINKMQELERGVSDVED